MEKSKQIGFFEKYLTVWVLACIVLGILLGSSFKENVAFISETELYGVNVYVAILIWLMIYPMMVQIDFTSLKNVKSDSKGLLLTVIVNWLVKPFTMALFAWIFFDYVYKGLMEPDLADQYIAGAILLGAAPCTAMVFVWSYLSDGDAKYTLIQVSINDLILLVAFIPIVQFLLGITDLVIPYEVLISSVVTFVVIPLVAGMLSNVYLQKLIGEEWFKSKFLPVLKPISIFALLLTLVLLFMFQGDVISKKPLTILLIAIPLTIQTYFIFFLTWFVGKIIRIRYAVCAPSSMIAASNFFELAVAVSISLFGLNSGASLATVMGVLIEVPVMLSLVWLAKRWKY
ncbi:MAG: ACR3 family arsenite efflux transporter [Crocinitomicaceae bacterium]|nr:ACR3 family arsenite efflux transporter [Crocinitomicaceae bacterium]